MDKGASVPDQALAVPVEPVARLDPSGFDPSRIVRAFNERLRIYRTKREESSPFGHMTHNRQEAYALVVEAIELLAREAGLAAVVPYECPECQGRGEHWSQAPGLPRAPYPVQCDYCQAPRDSQKRLTSENQPETADASGMEARQGRDAEERLDGEAATARPDAQPLEPKY